MADGGTHLWGGLRVTECCQLRVKDVDFDQGLLVVRSGKGDKDRTTLLAEMCCVPLRTQAKFVDAISCGCGTGQERPAAQHRPATHENNSSRHATFG